MLKNILLKAFIRIFTSLCDNEIIVIYKYEIQAKGINDFEAFYTYDTQQDALKSGLLME